MKKIEYIANRHDVIYDGLHIGRLTSHGNGSMLFTVADDEVDYDYETRHAIKEKYAYINLVWFDTIDEFEKELRYVDSWGK